MPLINIEYGSIASSEDINNNFTYLDEKINNIYSSANTDISSVQSNIATINSRLSEAVQDFRDSIADITATITEYKTKIRLLVSQVNMLPNWSAVTSQNFTSGKTYTAATNGYLLIVPQNSASGNISVNGMSVSCKNIVNAYDYSSDLTVIPLKAGDTVTTTVNCKYSYFVPVTSVTLE